MKDANLMTPPANLRAARKMRTGVVMSDKMDKTRVVKISWHSRHPRYHKVMRRFTVLYAHDAKNETHSGDTVELMETRPLSKMKRWRITRLVAKAEI